MWLHFSLQNGLSRERNFMLHLLKMPYCSKCFQDSGWACRSKTKSSFRFFMVFSFSVSIASNVEVIFFKLRFFKKESVSLQQEGRILQFLQLWLCQGSPLPLHLWNVWSMPCVQKVERECPFSIFKHGNFIPLCDALYFVLLLSYKEMSFLSLTLAGFSYDRER